MIELKVPGQSHGSCAGLLVLNRTGEQGRVQLKPSSVGFDRHCNDCLSARKEFLKNSSPFYSSPANHHSIVCTPLGRRDYQLHASSSSDLKDMGNSRNDATALQRCVTTIAKDRVLARAIAGAAAAAAHFCPSPTRSPGGRQQHRTDCVDHVQQALL